MNKRLLKNDCIIVYSIIIAVNSTMKEMVIYYKVSMCFIPTFGLQMVRIKCEKWVKTLDEDGESLSTARFGLEWFAAFHTSHTNITIT